MGFKYKILQIKRRNKEYDWRFEDWEFAKKEFCLTPYEVIYESEADIENTKEGVLIFLEGLFSKFNIEIHPSDYNGHSLSVSDLVQIENLGLYYCDSIGWQKIWLDEKGTYQSEEI